jgi:hypothetical protein
VGSAVRYSPYLARNTHGENKGISKTFGAIGARKSRSSRRTSRMENKRKVTIDAILFDDLSFDNWERAYCKEPTRRASFEFEYERDCGFVPDIRIYRKSTAPQITRDLQRWCNNRTIYMSTKWEDYVPRSDGKTIRDLYYS